MANQIRWGMIGCGAIASILARNIARSQTGQLVAVASRSQNKADAFAADPKHGQNIRALSSYEQLLTDKDVDLVFIALPHPFHAKWAIAAAQAGKHILCEKPVSINHSETMTMIHAARCARDGQGVFFAEGFMTRCHPLAAKLVELLREKTIGRLGIIRAACGYGTGFDPESRVHNNDLAGGGIMDVGCYPVSLARLLAGAALNKPFADPIEVTGTGHLTETGVDGWTTASLRFEQDIIAQLSTSITLAQDNSLQLFGSKGRINVPVIWPFNRDQGGAFEIQIEIYGDEQASQNVVVEADQTAFTYEVDAVGQAILSGQHQLESPAMSWDDTLGNIKTMDRWRQAIGLTYEMEKPDHARQKQPLHGGKLRQGAGTIPCGQIKGLDKPVSRVVMGVDNQQDISHASAMFDTFFEYGGTTFDTGYVYAGGKTEKLLGQWFANRGVRDQTVLITKGAHTPFCDPESLTRQLHESLERVGIDHTDIYMMHRDNLDVPVGEFVDVMNQHCKAGLFKVFGGSNWSQARLEEANAYAAKNGLQGFGVVSNNFSLAQMENPVWAGCIASSKPKLRQWHIDTQTPLMPWSSQARGFFTGRADLSADEQPDKEIVRCWYSEDNFKRRKRAQELAKKYDVLPINIALAYVLCQPFPTFPLIGPRILEELRTSLPGLNVKLSEQELAYLDLRD